MDIVVIFNGLGNQMSQYAFYLAKKEKNPTTKYLVLCKEHNGYELEKLFKIKQIENIIWEILLRILLSKRKGLIIMIAKKILNHLNIVLIEENFSYVYNPRFLETNSKRIAFYYGGWHNYRYLSSVDIKNIFNFPVNNINEEALRILDMIKTNNSVSVHIRRGDYLKENNVNIYGGICTMKYYEEAIAYIQQHVNNPFFFIFCNDELWVKRNLLIKNAIYVNCNKGGDSWIDMFLISNCKHNILANSTFSLWGAFLSQNDGIKICPCKFVNVQDSGEIFLDDWIKI